MTRTVRDALASFDDYEIERQLHDVPPHEVYEVRVDGRRAVCKVAAHPEAAPATEAALLAHVDAHTDIPVPSVLDAGEGYFVGTWLDGLPDGSPVPDDDPTPEPYARALGAGLARLHEATAGTFVRPGYPVPDFEGNGTGAVGLAVDARESTHDLALALLDDCERYLADIGRAAPVEEVRALFADRPGLLAGAGAPVVCHGNLLPDHAGFAGDPTDGPTDLAAVVDFEHGLVAPGEYDFWRTAHPMFGSPTRGTPAGGYEAFRAGYESVRSLPHGFERRETAYLLCNLASYLVALDLQNGGIGDAERPRVEGMAETISEVVADVRARPSR